MSAHIVADKTINRIVTFLMNPGENIDSPLDDVEYRSPSGRKFAAVKLGEAMLDLNVASVFHRYGPDGCEPVSPFVFVEEPTDRIQALKSLGCWLYQCDEGDLDKDPLYRRLCDVRTAIAMDIIGESEAYNAAEWG